MKILSAEETRALDAYTIAYEPIDSINLMERASSSFAAWYTHHFGPTADTIIFCGMGNNGGDGLAIARLLLERKYKVQVYIVHYASSGSADFEINYSRLKQITEVQSIYDPADLPPIGTNSIIIDAIFGSGINRPVSGLTAAVIDVINQSGAKVVAVDIPSGLYVDSYTADGHIIQADYTVSFQLPKLSFLLPQNSVFVGEWHLTDIGLHPEAIRQAKTPYYYTDQTLIKKMVRKRDKFSHKGTFGHALVIGGSYGKMGAVMLASRSCLRSGVGLLTVHVPGCGYEIMQIAVPEAMTVTDNEDKIVSEIADIQKYTVLGIGPGLGTASQTAVALENLFKQTDKPLVIDADGLNLLAASKELLALVPAGSILTPHPKEFERLAGKTDNEYQRLEVLKRFCAQNKVNVVLKGAHTAVGTPSGEVYFNSTGNPGMATGGSGDVLTGIITALLAQGYLPFEAAVLGVYFHGLAGDMAATAKGYNALIASDITDHLPQAFLQFEL